MNRDACLEVSEPSTGPGVGVPRYSGSGVKADGSRAQRALRLQGSHDWPPKGSMDYQPWRRQASDL